MKKLKSLEKYNKDQYKFYQEMEKLSEPRPNGLACPKCGKELWDSNPTMVLTSSPPQKNIHCPKCGYRGYAIN